MIRSLAFNVFFYVFTLLTAIVGIVLVPIPTPVVLRTVLHWWARAVVWGGRWIGGMKVEIRGRANLPPSGPPCSPTSITARATASTSPP